MKKFLPGQLVSKAGNTGTVVAVDRTPGMVDVKYPNGLTKRHTAQELTIVSRALNNGQGSRARRNPAQATPEEMEALAAIRDTAANLSAIVQRLEEQTREANAETGAPAGSARLALKHMAGVEEKAAEHLRKLKLENASSKAVAEAESVHSKSVQAYNAAKNALVRALTLYKTNREHLKVLNKNVLRLKSGTVITTSEGAHVEDASEAEKAKAALVMLEVLKTPAAKGGGYSAYAESAAEAPDVSTGPSDEITRQKGRESTKVRVTATLARTPDSGSPIEQIQKSGATWLTLPDPPRFIEQQGQRIPEICGNPLDGTMYVVYFNTQSKYSARTVTQEIYDAALKYWKDAKNKEAPVEDVLKVYLDLINKKLLGKLERRGPIDPALAHRSLRSDTGTTDILRKLRQAKGEEAEALQSELLSETSRTSTRAAREPHVEATHFRRKQEIAARILVRDTLYSDLVGFRAVREAPTTNALTLLIVDRLIRDGVLKQDSRQEHLDRIAQDLVQKVGTGSLSSHSAVLFLEYVLGGYDRRRADVLRDVVSKEAKLATTLDQILIWKGGNYPLSKIVKDCEAAGFPVALAEASEDVLRNALKETKEREAAARKEILTASRVYDWRSDVQKALSGANLFAELSTRIAVLEKLDAETMAAATPVDRFTGTLPMRSKKRGSSPSLKLEETIVHKKLRTDPPPSDAKFFELPSETGELGWYYFIYGVNVPAYADKLASFQPPFGTFSAKRKSPFFSWVPLKRPLDNSAQAQAYTKRKARLYDAPNGKDREALDRGTRVIIQDGNADPAWLYVTEAGGEHRSGWISTGDVRTQPSATYSRQPLCLSSRDEKLRKAASDMQNVIYAAKNALGSLGAKLENAKAYLEDIEENASTPKSTWAIKDVSASFIALERFLNKGSSLEYSLSYLKPGAETAELDFVIYDKVRDSLNIEELLSLAMGGSLRLFSQPLLKDKDSKEYKKAPRVKEIAAQYKRDDLKTSPPHKLLPLLLNDDIRDAKIEELETEVARIQGYKSAKDAVDELQARIYVFRTAETLEESILKQTPPGQSPETSAKKLASILYSKYAAAGIVQSSSLLHDLAAQLLPLFVSLDRVNDALSHFEERRSSMSMGAWNKSPGPGQEARAENAKKQLHALLYAFVLYWGLGGSEVVKNLNNAIDTLRTFSTNAGHLSSSYSPSQQTRTALKGAMHAPKEESQYSKSIRILLTQQKRLSPEISVATQFTHLAKMLVEALGPSAEHLGKMSDVEKTAALTEGAERMLVELSERLKLRNALGGKLSEPEMRRAERLGEELNKLMPLLQAYVLYWGFGWAYTSGDLRSVNNYIQVMLNQLPAVRRKTQIAAEEESVRKSQLRTSLQDVEAEIDLERKGVRAGTGLEGTAAFYTYNPVLFNIIRKGWGRSGPWGKAITPDTRNTMSGAFDEVDTVGRYGQALTLFYEQSLGKDSLEEAQKDVWEAAQTSDFRATIAKMLLDGKTLDAKSLERNFASAALLEPGMDLQERRSTWAQEYEDGEQGIRTSAGNLAEFPLDYLTHGRRTALQAVARQRQRQEGEKVPDLRPGESLGMPPLEWAKRSKDAKIGPYPQPSLFGEHKKAKKGEPPADHTSYLWPESSAAAFEQLGESLSKLKAAIEARKEEIAKELFDLKAKKGHLSLSVRLERGRALADKARKSFTQKDVAQITARYIEEHGEPK